MITSLLTRHFGFDRLRPGQEAVISRLLAGKSAAAIFPTGAGKSLCYQLPALALPHLTLVISPLLALMHDQLAFLRSKGIAAATLDSSQTAEESRRVMQQASDGQLKILMISVERLKNERFRRFIAHIPLSLLVVDEAHCISEWGHNFRPDYLKLPDHRRELAIPQVLLLTATATPAVMAATARRMAAGSSSRPSRVSPCFESAFQQPTMRAASSTFIWLSSFFSSSCRRRLTWLSSMASTMTL